MKTYELTWAVCPTNFNPHKIARVEAETPEDADTLLRDAIRAKGHAWFSIMDCREYETLSVVGKVISL